MYFVSGLPAGTLFRPTAEYLRKDALFLSTWPPSTCSIGRALNNLSIAEEGASMVTWMSIA
jgi:hypothetical protein